ncbi:alcohol dehydrogenase catalytic domain-containing protein [Actinokineospora globicatena]|uniref:alcohol dehydrogenase catalytic domain-containing protein n=1 Tax=Actinokineospora globicatena TaxID=103729 RepID=UPI0020A4166F|nr:alcohol dehydrogenase catalytic domain-containing protein [Actinokineospora globicatena]MCP2306147.1 alcohol dehydrogenase [Actinokineospora globicatena]GLW79978.1 alcohol dehydrogenase [Actinokineospora globicatena]GLW86807.1 alcohol dehydrogenase [Actinokineospora globicatena]
MKAMVYSGLKNPEWTEVPAPGVRDPGDAVVRVTAVTICGTDLHILGGDVPEVEVGRVLGHEAVGVVERVGPGVVALREGDRVLVSCISACGRCRFCRAGVFGQCRGGGGWVLGHTEDGTQAEYVRVPFADTSTHVLPDAVTDAAAVMLADVFPTAYEVGVRNGRVRPGDSVVVVGAGPIGLAAVRTANLYSPGHVLVVDPVPARRAAAQRLGADAAVATAEQAAAVVAEVTGGLGADVTIEAVGVPETFELCASLVRPGGRVANVGVHGRPAALHLEQLWIKDVTITTGLVDTITTPELLRMVAAGRLDVEQLITHRFELGEMARAYQTFADAADTGALKVVLSR